MKFFAILAHMSAERTKTFILPPKPPDFTENLAVIRQASITDNDGYSYIAAGLVNQLLARAHPDSEDAKGDGEMTLFQNPGLDTCLRFRFQVEQANLDRRVKIPLMSVLMYAIDQGFSPDFITNAAHAIEESTTSQQEKQLHLQNHYPYIIQLWQSLYPQLQTIHLDIAEPTDSPLEKNWYQPQKSANTLFLPFNWKLTTEMTKHVHTSEIRNIAKHLDIKPAHVTDEILLTYYFLNAAGQAMAISQPELQRPGEGKGTISVFAIDIIKKHIEEEKKIIEEEQKAKRKVDLDKLFFTNSILNAEEAIAREKFQALLEKYKMEEDAKDYIFMAYNVAFNAHKGYFRQSGEPYFSHLRETAIILLKAGIRNPLIIAAALLHDVTEDTNYFTQGRIDPYAPTYEMYRKLQRIFGSDLSEIIKEVTERERIYDQLSPYHQIAIENAEEEYRERFKYHYVRADSMILKMADRLHNLRTLRFMLREKQIAKIQETREYYLEAFTMLVDPPSSLVPKSYERARKILYYLIVREIEKREIELGLAAPRAETRRRRSIRFIP